MKLMLPRFDKARVLVVGDVMLDRYWHGSTSRISPEAPVPVVKVGLTEDRAGGAANVALNITALGAQASLIGVVGNDDNGRALKTRLQAAEVKTNFVVSKTAPTITKLRVISRHQQLLRMDFEETIAAQDAASLSSKVVQLLMEGTAANKLGAIILSDYAKGTLGDPQAIIKAARSKKIPVFVDPKGSDFSRYHNATLLTPNLHEFEAVVGSCKDERELVTKGQALLKKLQLDALLITRGENGMTLLLRTSAKRVKQLTELHLPAKAIEVFDVTGAGDTVISVLATAVAAGESLANAVTLSNIAAGIVVGKLGTATVSTPELANALQSEHGISRGVVTEDQLQILLRDAQSRHEKIVFTNGCFDILHAGHVGYLEEARKLGDRLIVAVNSDSSVKRLKGEGRPINIAEDRMLVLSKLEAVDWVVCFNDATPERLLTKLKPDILAKGGDYKINQVVGAPIVQAYGGQVKVLSLLDNRSTTAIVNKIQKQTKT